VSVIGQDDFERTLQGPGGTHQFAIGAPPAFIYMNEGNLVLCHNQGTAPANRYTQAASIAFGLVKYRHYRQFVSPLDELF
jgi:hypothetical protein